jgi:hypothetical protein
VGATSVVWGASGVGVGVVCCCSGVVVGSAGAEVSAAGGVSGLVDSPQIAPFAIMEGP